jgi:hypothetical protein
MSKLTIFQVVSLLVMMNGVIFALNPDSEPEWNLVEEYGLFQSSDNLVAGMKRHLKFSLFLRLNIIYSVSFQRSYNYM